MNFYSIGAIWCRVKGHRWSHSKMEPLGMGKHKVCLRCNLKRVVKTRRAK